MNDLTFAGPHARVTSLALAVSCLLASQPGVAQPDVRDPEPVVVTAARMLQPLLVETDPKAPRQPLPAHDGADYLKTVPGFSVIRKGGTDGDPVFRGMAASRINMLMDGEMILGGCGMRMDPPTAYVFPAAYDRIVVIKGPQTVLHGPGNSAATVRFERDMDRTAVAGQQMTASVTSASAGRSDLAADLLFGTGTYYGRLAATHAQSSDYSDGDGRRVHSSYERWSGNGAVGWRPGEGSWVELSAARSDGEAAYADRAMDGTRFDRENLSLRFGVETPGAGIAKIEGLVFSNYIDHVMDSYSLRNFVATARMPFPSVSNPDRRTEGARLALELPLTAALLANVGIDAQRNEHRVRSSMNEPVTPYRSQPRVEDARFTQWGVFSELSLATADGSRVIAGARVDRWQATDGRLTLRPAMMPVVANPTANEERDATLTSGFARYEHSLARTTLFAGAGYVERFPDYWELVGAGRESPVSLSAFGTRPERTRQLDAGLLHAAGDLSLSLSGFVSEVSDFILIQTQYAKGMRQVGVVRNVDATTWGAEADLAYELSDGWRLSGTLAWAGGTNDTDGLALGQMPPLEGRLSLAYQGQAWSATTLLRSVRSQDRVALYQGNIVGQDIGPSAGFTVLSASVGYRLPRGLQVNAGVDNLFDQAYAEHISRAGSMVSGFTQTTRVNEPGRTLWLNVSMDF